MLSAAGALAGAPALADDAADDGLVLKQLTYEFRIDREERAAAPTALPRKLLSFSPQIGAVAEYDGDWRFSFDIGPRRMVGVAGGLDVDAWGYQASGYVARWIAPGLLAGVGAGYQLDQGSLSNQFVDFSARLDTGRVTPFVVGGFPAGRTLVQGGLYLNIERSQLKVETFDADRFATHDVEAEIGVVQPLNLRVDVELGVRARYTYLEDTALNSQARAEQSGELFGGVAYRLTDDLSFTLDAELRVFDDVVDEGAVIVGLRQTF